MNIETLVSELVENNIHLWLEEGKLKFRAPKEGLPDHIRRKIVERRDDIILLLNQQNLGKTADILRPVGRENPLPLSFEQERLWFLHQLYDELALFNMIYAFEWQGQVDVAALETAIRQIIRRHEILRSQIQVIDGVPFQVPMDQPRWCLSVEDHPGVDAVCQKTICQSAYNREQSTVFDLASGEVMRTRLLRFDDRTVLFFSMDHIVSDAWSQQILLSEFCRFYWAAVSNSICTLAPLPVQYADYAVWQRNRFASGELQASIDFWRNNLDETSFRTRLSTDYSRSAKKTFRGKFLPYAMKPDLLQGIRFLCKRHALTFSSVLLSAYALLVARYTRSESVSFGIPTAGREQPELHQLIGFFVNVIVCRIDVPESGSVLAFMQSVRQSLLKAWEHQHVPIECLAEIMNLGRGFSEHFDIPMAFNFVEKSNVAGNGHAHDALPLVPLPFDSGEVASKHEVTLYLDFSSTEVGGGVEYNADLFSHETMECFLAHFDKILEYMIRGSEEALRSISWYDNADVLHWLRAEHPQASRAFPLSPVQRDIYFSALLDPSTKRNNLGYVGHIYSPIDVDRWQTAVTRLTADSDLLRMRLHRFKDSKIADVYQWLSPEVELDYRFYDWFQGDSSVREPFEEFIDAFIHRPFDLENGPLNRLALIRLSDDHYAVVFAAHHVLFDGGAVLVHAKRLVETYVNGDAVIPQPHGVDEYEAYVETSRATMDTREIIDFWREKLSSVEALPVSEPDAQAGLVSRMHQFDKDLWEAVKKYCRSCGITPAIYCKGIYGLLIDYYFQGQSDFLITEFSLGRSEAQADDFGCYYRQQPFVFPHTMLQGNRTFAEFWGYHKDFQRACKSFAGLSPHAQNQLIPAQNINFMYNYNGYIKQIEILFGSEPGDQQGFIPQIEDAVQFYVKNVAQDMQINLVYPSGTFADDRLLERFMSITRQLCMSGCSTLATVDFLLTDETRQLVEWEACCAVSAKSAPDVLSLFTRQASVYGDHIAVRDAGVDMTYAMLDAQSNALARRLLEQHVKPGDKVALLFPRDYRFVVAMLAAAKASVCYVPLDPTHPLKRLDYILEDAAVAVVITCEELVDLVDPQRCPLLLWESLSEALERAPAVNVEDSTLPSDPDRDFYVIYTSGTTGNPKGVLVSAGNVTSLFHGCSDLFDFDSTDRWSVCHSFAFDFSVWELWGPLITGGCAHIVDAATIKDSPQFHGWLRHNGISVLSQTPSAFLALELEDRQHKDEQLESLRYVVFGGEALDINHLHSWRERHTLSKPVLINMYGITEITVHATFHEITENDFIASRNTIGNPLPHLKTVVLDSCLRRVPPGFPGELFIAGDGVAQGYLNREALTCERFFSIPQLGHGSARFYRSGDRVRYLTDGNLQYLGRNDRQVKIRGYRIELDEIENVLRSCKGVSAAAVKVVELAEPIGKRVIAYVCHDQTEKGDLMSLMQERLPHYMVPSNVVELPQLPLTDNGKINYRALPDPDLHVQSEEDVALETDTQVRLAEIMGELLQQRVSSRTANFFALGGHSLLATQLASRIEHQFNLELPLRIVFQHARLDELADEIDRRIGVAGRCAGNAIMPRPRDIPLSLSFAQQRLWFLYQVSPQNPFYNMPMVIQFEKLDKTVLEKTLLHIIARHEVFRTNLFLDEEGKSCVVIKEIPLDWKLEEIDLSGLPDSQRHERVKAEIYANTNTPFSLEKDLLLRCKLLNLGDRYVLLAATHHIAADGWSLGVLRRETSELYAAFIENRPSPLPPLPIQYSDFAHWQRQWLSGERLQTYLDYWRRQLDGVEQLDFPTDRIRPAQVKYRGDYVPLALGLDVSSKLRTLAQEQEATLFMVLLAALYTLLARCTGQRDLCIGTPIANRNHVEIEALVGFFVNTLVLRVQMDETPSFEDFLRVVKRVSLEAYEYQDMPFELLVDHLNIERDASRNPLFQIMFVLQNMPKNIATSESNSLTGKHLESGSQSSIFDMRVELCDDTEALWGRIEFNVDLFDRSTIEALAAAYQHLITQIVAAPGCSVMDYALLDESSRRQQIEEFNSTSATLDDIACLHHLIERQCRITPNKVALRFEDCTMTYRQLDTAANRVACRLQALGVCADELVGIAMDRSLEMVVGLLAVLKAGGGYVPIDPDYPANRCRHMVEDTAVKVVLTQPRFQDWDVLMGVETVLVMSNGQLVDDEASSANQQDSPALALAGTDSICYVIYTSGSTGLPKGVMNVHRALVNRIAWMQTQYRLTQDDVVLQKTPYSFDVSVWEFFWPLAYGATLVVAKPEGHRDPQYLAEIIAREGVTTLHFVPSMLQTFLRLADISACTSLRRIICSGEALGKDLEQRCRMQLPHAELHNLYGPTEAAVDVSYWLCDGLNDNRPLPIGYPISNCYLFVLDSQGELLPRGAVGELHIGGVGLARGYWNRPELTEEKFIYSKRLGMRLYKTGDKARHRFDGALEYFGRIDHQVKIHGLRIELGEIESVLTRAGNLLSAAVMLWENKAEELGQSNKLLVAYVVPSSDALAVLAQQDDISLSASKVGQWADVFDGIYAGSENDERPEFNIAGWNSSYTGKPIEPAQMEDWVNNTVERIAALAGPRVLEVGCGTGLLLFRLAERVHRYVATDISAHALSDIENRIGQRENFAHVQLMRVAAEDCDASIAEVFDTIVLNSVVQYFPNIEYAEKVLHGLVDKLPTEGGNLFIGDVRHLGLQRAFHTSVVCSNASPRRTITSIRRDVEEQILREAELLIDPVFFYDFCRCHQRDIRCRILLKREDSDNEMANFRYDVVLSVTADDSRTSDASGMAPSHLVWPRDLCSIAALSELAEDRVYVISGVPNPRVHQQLELAEGIFAVDVESHQELGDLQTSLSRCEGPALGDFWNWAENRGWHLEMACDRHDLRCVDLLLVGPRFDVDPPPSLMTWQYADITRSEEQLVYANQPMMETLERLLIKQLRNCLGSELPTYMVPQQFIVLDKLPLTASGKLDRKALPAPKTGNYLTQNLGRYVAPQTPLEQQMARLWCDLLKLDKVSMTADFFALGGHSLLGVELIAQVKKLTGHQIPLVSIFTHQTLEAFCRHVEAQGYTPEAIVKFGVALPLTPQSHLDKLFCIHPGTGDALSYRALATHLDSKISVWGIQVPGFDVTTDDPILAQHVPFALDDFTSFTQLAGHYCEVISQIQPTGPYRVLGWSSGGLLALEIARQLQEQGKSVSFVGMVDSQIPDSSRFDYTLDNLIYLQDKSTQALQQHPLFLMLEELGHSTLSSAAQINHFIRITKYLRKLEGVHLPVMPIGPVHLFVAEDSSAIDGGDKLPSDWQSFSGVNMHIHTAPGNHYTVFQKGNVGMFAAKLLNILELSLASDLQSASLPCSELSFHGSLPSLSSEF